MPLYEIRPDGILPFQQTSFATVGIREREDLQRLLKQQIDIVCPDVLVIAEGFRDWEESRREIDLLALDKDANLVVIELKRTDDAGHAELQAIRYAAMVSAMTFDRAAEAYAEYRRANGESGDAAEAMLKFLDWAEPDEDSFAQDVRMVLIAADFSKELTTSVMWLNEHGLDIRCVQLQPYRDGSRVLVDVQQVIPLREAQDYIVRIREKSAKERQDRAEQGSRQELRKEFWRTLLERSIGKTDLFENVSPSEDSWIVAGSGVSDVHYMYRVRRHSAEIQFILEAGKANNKQWFDWLYDRRGEIERAYGAELDWGRNDDLKRSSINQVFDGGYKSEREEWPLIQDRMIEAMVRMERAFSPYVPQLRSLAPPSPDADAGVGTT